jgi:hypothetical protein
LRFVECKFLSAFVFHQLPTLRGILHA